MGALRLSDYELAAFQSQGRWEDVDFGLESTLIQMYGKILGSVVIDGDLAKITFLPPTRVGYSTFSGIYAVFSERIAWKSKRCRSEEGFLAWLKGILKQECDNVWVEEDGFCTLCGSQHFKIVQYKDPAERRDGPVEVYPDDWWLDELEGEVLEDSHPVTIRRIEWHNLP